MRRAPLFRGCVHPSGRAGSLRGITRLRGVLRVALESSVELTAAPRPGALDFNLEREAGRDADDGEHAQNGDALEGWIDDDRAHDVGDDEHLESEQNATAEVAAQAPVRVLGSPTRDLSREQHKRPDPTEDHDRGAD